MVPGFIPPLILILPFQNRNCIQSSCYIWGGWTCHRWLNSFIAKCFLAYFGETFLFWAYGKWQLIHGSVPSTFSSNSIFRYAHPLVGHVYKLICHSQSETTLFLFYNMQASILQHYYPKFWIGFQQILCCFKITIAILDLVCFLAVSPFHFCNSTLNSEATYCNGVPNYSHIRM